MVRQDNSYGTTVRMEIVDEVSPDEERFMCMLVSLMALYKESKKHGLQKQIDEAMVPSLFMVKALVENNKRGGH